MCATGILPTGTRLRSRSSQAPSRSKPAVEGRALPELRLHYDALYQAYGPQHWWPGRTRFEVIVGAILTQSTSWSNVEQALRALRREKLLSPGALERISTPRLARLIRSSGYFQQKAEKLKAFVHFLRKEYGGSLDKLFAVPTRELREQLLSVRGNGPETADSILLYAGKHAVFVVDAYTRRILERHELAVGKQSYEQIQELFEHNLPASVAMFNEYHALIVHTGKHFCRKSGARCEECALRPFLPRSEEVRG
jgi:endonuclease III related protein